jgi:hypothetical protein
MDCRRLAVVALDRPLPRAYPEVAVIGKRVAVERAGRVRREEFVPPSAPDVVERRSRVGPPEVDPGVLPQEVVPGRLVHEVEYLGTRLGEDRDEEVLGLERDPGDAGTNVLGIDEAVDGVLHGNRRSRSVQPLTAPAVSPRMKKRWPKR